MANNVYIGMRYVPIFKGAWDSSLSYEALCIVEYGNNTYTSKKPVPAGTLPTDTDYWALSGNYNGQISALQTRMSTAESNISDLDNRIDRRFILIGDSYAIGVGTTPDDDGWAYLFKNFLGLDNYHCYLSLEGGSGFIGNAALRFIDKLESAAAAVSDPDTITDIVVCGGWNDINKAGVGDAVEAFCVRAATLFPNALISIGMVGYSSTASASQRAYIRPLLRQYYVGRTRRSRVLPNVEFALRTNTGLMGSDGIHPTANGYIALTKCIISAVFGGDGYDYYNDYVLVNYTDITGHTKPCIQLVEHEWTSVRFTKDLNSIQIGTTKPTGNVWFKIADFDSNTIMHGVALDQSQLDLFYAEGDVSCFFGAAGYKTVHALLGIFENSLYIRLVGIDASTGAWYDYTNLQAIGIEGTYYFKTLDV